MAGYSKKNKQNKTCRQVNVAIVVLTWTHCFINWNFFLYLWIQTRSVHIPGVSMGYMSMQQQYTIMLQFCIIVFKDVFQKEAAAVLQCYDRWYAYKLAEVQRSSLLAQEREEQLNKVIRWHGTKHGCKEDTFISDHPTKTKTAFALTTKCHAASYNFWLIWHQSLRGWWCVCFIC